MGSVGGYAQGMKNGARLVAPQWLGRISFDEAHALQRALVDARAAGGGEDVLLGLEHDPVLTLGRSASASHLHLDEAEYRARGIDVRRVERGGEVTYHGPGHLVMYAIVDLRSANISVRAHVRALEGALIDACAAFGVAAQRRDGAPGCWVGDRKIGAVGVRVERGIAWHGLALNVGRDLETFATIDPCGHVGVVSTSIAAERDWQAVAAGRRDQVGAAPPPLESVAVHAMRSYATAIEAYIDPATLALMEHAAAIA